MESKEELSMISAAALGGAVIGQLDELAMNAGTDAPVIIDTVGRVLTIVEDNYHLVPKIKIAVDDELVDQPPPEDAIEVSLAKYWKEANS